MANSSLDSTSRRDFIAAGVAALAIGETPAQRPTTARATPLYRRLNMADRAAEQHLRSYERGVTAMLALPPSDPRNWYRHALIHTLDCPHGNWWFLPWHRGYIGWLEAIIRDLSGDRTFALPYWDWTVTPRLPDAVLTGNLNPANFSITGFADFKSRFRAPVSSYYASFSAQQLTQLTLRNFPSEDFLWAAIQNVPGDPYDSSMFSDISYVRELSPPRSLWFDARTSMAVSIEKVLDALYSTTFEEFGSEKTGYHNVDPGVVAQGVLESEPHNRVHNNVGGLLTGPPDRVGFMSEFLSPVDPIFFLHHANLDRLWDVWTRRQQTLSLPTAPAAPADLQVWSNEPFLFFVGPDGLPALRQTSGDYIAMAVFDYDYQPGSGEEGATPTPRSIALRAEGRTRPLTATLLPRRAALSNQQTGSVDAIGGLSLADLLNRDKRFIARITVEVPADSRHLDIHVLVNAAQGARNVTFADPSYAGTYRQFGGHHAGNAHHSRDLTFSIGITGAVKQLLANSRFAKGQSLQISVVAEWPGISMRTAEINVKSISVVTI